MDTIFALATAPGRAGVAVIRISGPAARTAAEVLAGPLPDHGRTLRELRDRNGQLLDEALVLTFEKGRSFTGEMTVELHVHGSPAIIAAVMRCLGCLAGLRMAEAGEFTRRAMEQGRLDLAQVEGLADLIAAETEAQHRQAIRVFSGKLGELAEGWRERLLKATALLAVTIDFVDEELPDDLSREVDGLVASVRREMEREASGVAVAERVRDGFEVAILGRPNVGKSSLLNNLAGRDAAITSETAGTTRDVIEVRLDIAGLPVTLLDTAGLRDAKDVVEGLGIARGLKRAKDADLRIYLTEPGEVPSVRLEAEDIVVQGKMDLFRPAGVGISTVTGEGIDELVDRIGRILGDRAVGVGTAIRVRHRIALKEAIDRLGHVSALVKSGPEIEDIAAEELRGAVAAVDMIVGRMDVEEVLGEIFSSFCIGK